VPTLVLEAAGQPRRTIKLVRPLTTIGGADENDVHVPRAGLEPTHAQISREPDGYWITGMTRDMSINGRREKHKKLVDGDVVRIGDVTLTWQAMDTAEAAPAPPHTPVPSGPATPAQGVSTPKPSTPPGAPTGKTREIVSAYRRVHEFSQKLLDNASTAALVETLLDAVVELTGADKGFLVMLDADGRPEVRAARQIDGAALVASELSDSILRKVFESKQPLVVADALRDQNFNASASVVNLKLLSVMCCPLLDRGELLGAIYVGNNRVAHVFDPSALEVMGVFAAQASLLLSQQKRLDELVTAKAQLEDAVEDLRFGSVVGACDSMKEIYKRIRKVATTDISVLITGETGTGKELIAREVHAHSRRAKGPFVVINCGAIPENLLESELFGHVRGAFTGAVATKQGRFQAAGGGTLFLDEIGELPLALQVKLLRALQEHVVIKVGDNRPERVDIRVVAATNRVLEEEIKAGRFREDLYYRLNVVNLHLPPLRDRGDDLLIIAKFLLSQAVKEQPTAVRGFSKSCVAAMRAYKWPGNIRQLENRLRKAAVLADGPMLSAEDMDLRPEDVEEILPLAEARARWEARYINEVLERNAGNRTQTARDLGVDPRTIFRHLARKDSPILPETGEVGAELDDEGPPRP
jgi:transcriptional regulator with GAF, ATPase, and Fis domain